MAYDVYFDKTLLPVTPSQIKMQIKNKNKTVELINNSEINILKSPGLTDISFSVLLPHTLYPFSKYPKGFVKQKSYLEMLEKYKTQRKSFQFIVTRVSPKGEVIFHTSMKVSLEDYTIDENAANGFDIVVNVKLKQYQTAGAKTVQNGAATKTRSDGNKANTEGEKYTIVSGDTLWNISKKKLGDGSKWTKIYQANIAVIENAAKKHGRKSSSFGHWIYPGTVITIPSKG